MDRIKQHIFEKFSRYSKFYTNVLIYQFHIADVKTFLNNLYYKFSVTMYRLYIRAGIVQMLNRSEANKTKYPDVTVEVLEHFQFFE